MTKEEKVFHRESREGSKRSRGSRANRFGVMLWSLVAVAGTVGVLVAAFMLWLLPQMRQKDATGVWNSDKVDQAIRVMTKYDAPSPEEAQKIVASAMSVTNEVDVDNWLRRGDATHAEVIAFMADTRAKHGEPVERQWLGSIDRNGMQLEGIELIYQKDGKQTSLLALLLPDANGIWKMDFGGFARKVQPSWETLVTVLPPAEGDDAKPESWPVGVMRVLCLEGTYFNGVFADDGEWASFGMMCLDHPDFQLAGYCKIGSRQHKAMTHILSKWPEGVLPRVTLKVRRVPGAEEKQLEIVSVLAEDWALGDRNFEDLIDEGWR